MVDVFVAFGCGKVLVGLESILIVNSRVHYTIRFCFTLFQLYIASNDRFNTLRMTKDH